MEIPLMEKLNFKDFASKMNAFLAKEFKGEAFTTDIAGEVVWDAYLNAFPEGTNDIFRERRYHDGSYDKNTILALGNVVTFKDGELLSIWDCPDLEYPYNLVAKELSELVKSREISSFFRTKFKTIGNKPNRDNHQASIIWDHFLFDIPSNLIVFRTETVEEVVGKLNENRTMLLRAISEITPAALDTILELIDSNNLYRGSEHRENVHAMKEVINLTPEETWTHAHNFTISRFRNSVIGTLAVDISKGVDIEHAVNAFESKVAPQNYKRPKAIITQVQVDNAMDTINELGLEASLERRLATVADISINDVLWVNNETQAHMKDGVRSLLESSVRQKAVNTKTVQEISIDDFMNNIVPNTKKLEAFVSNSLTGNLMTLTAPKNPDSSPLFKWDNGFAWSYNGDVADSIKGRVIKAGGGVDGKLRVSLAWDNPDDLDLHCYTPSRVHYYFGNRDGILDVDMNAGSITNSVDPVENMLFKEFRDGDGDYVFEVHNYNSRANNSKGFTIQVEYGGNVEEYKFDRQLYEHERTDVLYVEVKNGEVKSVNPSGAMKAENSSTELWGIKSEEFVPVTMIMNSPNHWEGSNKTGNKHTFFILEGCKNPQSARGIYNEFLKDGLEKHRRVFEVLGIKSRCETSDEQLSGVGLSSTKKDAIIVRADGRNYKINFGE